MIEMKYLKNNLMSAPLANFFVFSLCAILIFAANTFGQRDLSRITTPSDFFDPDNPKPPPNSLIPANCRDYIITLTTGDSEPSGFGKVFATINGSSGSTGKIEISGGEFQRYNASNPTDKSCVVNGDATTFVSWSKSGPTFSRNTKSTVFINTLDVGNIDSVTIEHSDLNPQWFLSRIQFSSLDTRLFNRFVDRWFVPGTLKQTFYVNEKFDLADYKLTIVTGDVYQGGTNSKIYVSLNGRNRVNPAFELNNLVILKKDPFDSASLAQAEIYDQPNPDGLSSITINLEKGARWFLGSITITNSRSSIPDIFRYNHWIEGGTPVTIYPVEGRRSPTRKITFRNEAGFNARMMIQYLENGQQGVQLPKFVFSSEMPFAQNSVIEIPQDTKNVSVSLIGVATVNNNFYVSNSVGYLAGDPCFKAWGTLFSPQGGTCDGNPVATTTLNPIRPSLYPDTVAEGEQGCSDLMQSTISKDTTQKLRSLLNESSIKRLCKGSKDPYTTTGCYVLRVIDISSENAIAECSGQVPLGSTPKIGATTNTSGSNSTNTNIAQNEQDCFSQIQGKVAYDTAGNKRWNENNIKNLCRGTTNPPATIACFSSKMPQLGWSQASQECAAESGSSQAQTRNKMPVPSSNQPTSSGPNLEGSWEMYNDKGVRFDKFAKIAQSGSNLSINNGYGANSTAVLNGNSLKTSDGLSGTISPDGTKINWDINYVWVKQVSAPVNNQTPITSPNSNGTVQTANLLGTAKDIDAKNGAVWIIGTNPVAGGYGIYQFNGSGWTQIDGGATRIAVDNTGNPWIINEDGMVFRRTGNAWTAIAGPNGANPLDIAISNSGEVWIVTDTGAVSRWTGSGWTNLIAISARRVIFTPNPDTFQIVDENGKRFVRESGTSWIAATDASGMADKFIEYAVDGDTKWGIDSSFNIQKLGSGQSQANNTVAETQIQPTSQITNVPTPNKRTFTFRNEAGFVAKMMISYFEAGPGGVPMPKFLFSDNIPVGQNRTLEIPTSAPNMQVTVSLIGSGTVKDNFYSTSLEATFTGNRCFKSWGTLFSPQGGNCQ